MFAQIDGCVLKSFIQISLDCVSRQKSASVVSLRPCLLKTMEASKDIELIVGVENLHSLDRNKSETNVRS